VQNFDSNSHFCFSKETYTQWTLRFMRFNSVICTLSTGQGDLKFHRNIVILFLFSPVIVLFHPFRFSLPRTGVSKLFVRGPNKPLHNSLGPGHFTYLT